MEGGQEQAVCFPAHWSAGPAISIRETCAEEISTKLWTGDRFILLYIRLADGCFQWPGTAEEARSITPEEFKRLMDGFSVDSSVGPGRVASVNDPKAKRKR